MTTSEKHKMSNSFNKQFKNTGGGTFKDGKNVLHFNNMHKCHKMKRLKSHRERNHIRGCGKNASKSSSQHQHCHCLSSKDLAHFHSSIHHSSRRDAPSSSAIPVMKELSIITENRLIGHQGLFNHEVKSIDIERLLSEQRKMEKISLQEKKTATPCLSSPSQVPTPFSIVDVVGDTDKWVLFEDKSFGASKLHDELCDKEKDNVQRLAHTPCQVPQETSSESCNSNQIKVGTVKNGKAKHIACLMDRETKLMSTCKRKNTKSLERNAKEKISSMEHMPNSQECSGLHTQTCSLSPVKPPRSSSAKKIDLHQKRRDPCCSVSQSVCTLATGFCNRLKFPFLKKRSLVEESREVLLNALQERDGPLLQENLLQVWSCLSFDPSVKKGSLHQEETPVAQDESLPTAFSPDQVNASLEIRRSRHFSWQSSPQLQHNPKHVRPVETPVSFLDRIFRCTHSPELCEHFFTSSPASPWRKKKSASPHSGDGFSWARRKESVRFDSLNQTRRVGETRSNGSHYSKSPLFLYQPRLQPRHRPVDCRGDEVPFETKTYSLVPNFQHQQQESLFQTFNQTVPPLSCFSHTSHLTDMDIYPPSYVLDKEPPPYFPSLEPWSFPPMRLY